MDRVVSGWRGSIKCFCPHIAECKDVDIWVLVDDVADSGIFEIHVFVKVAEYHVVVGVFAISVERVVDLSHLGIVFVFGLWMIPIGEIPFNKCYVVGVFLEGLECRLREVAEFSVVIHIKMVDPLAFIVMVIKWE